MGYNDAKRRVIADLNAGAFQHEARDGIDVKNKLAGGEVTAADVCRFVKRSRGTGYSCSPHHADKAIDVHVIVSVGWYIKFYFVDPDTMFISVHEEGQT